MKPGRHAGSLCPDDQPNKVFYYDDKPDLDVNKPEDVIPLQWSPFKKGHESFVPSQKDFMINYTVQNIEGLVEKLKENGVTVLDDIGTYDYGKFVHIMDAEGNKIELWEP